MIFAVLDVLPITSSANISIKLRFVLRERD